MAIDPQDVKAFMANYGEFEIAELAISLHETLKTLVEIIDHHNSYIMGAAPPIDCPTLNEARALSSKPLIEG
jgi:hypothetical protein